MERFNVAVIYGDGIGPEVVREAIKTLNAVKEVFNREFEFERALLGGEAIDNCGMPLPEKTLETCKKSRAVLFGAIGGPKWSDPDPGKRPEAGLLKLRKELNVYCNLRPVKIHSPLISVSPLKEDVVIGTDIMVVRELTGGIYFGERGRYQKDGISYGFDTEKYSDVEVKRIAAAAFELARKRRKKVVSVDKANALESSRFWREQVEKVSKKYSDVELIHMYVDNCAMQIMKDPKQFDVIVTSNLFGDILSDEASMITGSIGMLPSASMDGKTFGLYEPIHGSAPDIAGKNTANPLAAILSAAMMLRYTFDLEKEACAVEKAVDGALRLGYRTADIKTVKGEILLGTKEMGDKVADAIYGII